MMVQRSRQHPLFDQSVLGLAGKIEELIDTHNLFDSKAGRVLEVCAVNRPEFAVLSILRLNNGANACTRWRVV